MSLNPIIALAAVIKSCSDAKTRVKQNKRLCAGTWLTSSRRSILCWRLKKNERGHERTLTKLLEVV